MADESEIPTQTILLIGESGVGKSSFGDALLGQKTFETGRNGFGVTTVTQSGEAVINGMRYCVIDSPGFEDPKGADADERHLSQMVQFLKNYQRGILVIALVVQCRTYRLRQGVQKIIRQMDQMFHNCDVWRHFCLVFSFYIPQFEQERENQSSMLGECLRSVIVEITKIEYELKIPAFFVDSTNAATDQHTRSEIKRFYQFSASQERPVSTNGLVIPDCVFMSITKTTETRRVKVEPIKVPYNVEIEYVEQVAQVGVEEYVTVENRDVEETYMDFVTVKVPYDTHHSRNRFLGIWWDRWTETEWRDEIRPVQKTRTVQRTFPVTKTRSKTVWVPEKRQRTEIHFRDGNREFWEEVEIETRTTLSGKKLPPSSRILKTWTNDV
jgi:hypothetical protein